MVLSVRFSAAELDELRARAETQGVKVTASVRSAALANAAPIDKGQLQRLVMAVMADGTKLAELVGRSGSDDRGVRKAGSGG